MPPLSVVPPLDSTALVLDVDQAVVDMFAPHMDSTTKYLVVPPCVYTILQMLIDCSSRASLVFSITDYYTDEDLSKLRPTLIKWEILFTTSETHKRKWMSAKRALLVD